MTNTIEKFLQTLDTTTVVKNTIDTFADSGSVLNTYCPLVGLSQLTADEQIESHVKSKKAGIAYRWDKETQNYLKQSLELAVWKGVPLQNTLDTNGKLIVGQNNDLSKVIVGTVASLVRSHINLLDSLAWQELQNNSLLLPDLDWYSEVYPFHDLRDLHKQYQQIHGYSADAIVMSTHIVKSILKILDEENDGEDSRSDLEIVNRSASEYNLPPIVVVDDCVDITGSDGTVMMTRFLDKDTIVFLSRQSGFRRVLGGTLEANGASGVFIRTYTDSDGTEVTDTISRPSVLSSHPSFAFKVKT